LGGYRITYQNVTYHETYDYSSGTGKSLTWTFNSLVPGQQYEIEASWNSDSGDHDITTDATVSYTNGSGASVDSPANFTDPSGMDATDGGPTLSTVKLANGLSPQQVSPADQVRINAYEDGYGQSIGARLALLTQERKEFFDSYDPSKNDAAHNAQRLESLKNYDKELLECKEYSLVQQGLGTLAYFGIPGGAVGMTANGEPESPGVTRPVRSLTERDPPSFVGMPVNKDEPTFYLAKSGIDPKAPLWQRIIANAAGGHWQIVRMPGGPVYDGENGFNWHFNPNWTWEKGVEYVPLYRNSFATLQWGPNAGMSACCATDAQIIECLWSKPGFNDRGYSAGCNDCQTDVMGAIVGAGLNGYNP
jgi:hypothetical protein